MSLHGSRVFVKWVVGVLDAGGLEVALGGKPATVPAGSAWAAVYAIAGGTVSGTILDPNSDFTPAVQVTSVAYDPEQTLWHVDKVRELLLAAVPATLTDGRHVVFGEPAFSDPSLIRDNDVSPPAWYCPDRISFRTAN